MSSAPSDLLAIILVLVLVAVGLVCWPLLRVVGWYNSADRRAARARRRAEFVWRYGGQ